MFLHRLSNSVGFFCSESWIFHFYLQIDWGYLVSQTMLKRKEKSLFVKHFHTLKHSEIFYYLHRAGSVLIGHERQITKKILRVERLVNQNLSFWNIYIYIYISAPLKLIVARWSYCVPVLYLKNYGDYCPSQFIHLQLVEL